LFKLFLFSPSPSADAASLPHPFGRNDALHPALPPLIPLPIQMPRAALRTSTAVVGHTQHANCETSECLLKSCKWRFQVFEVWGAKATYLETRNEWENLAKENLENSGGSESPKEFSDSELPDQPPDSEPPDSMVSCSPLVFVSKKF
jgi:hypothetical protein